MLKPLRSLRSLRDAALFVLSLFCMVLTSCASGVSMEDASVDVMFRRTGAVADDTLTLTTPALVSEMNGAYEIESIAYLTGSQLDESGKVEAGSNAVFAVRFVDLGGISVLRTDDTRVSLRAELGPDGKVVNALLGSTSGSVEDGFMSAGNDVFESGTWEVLYDGPELVVGRIDLNFRKYRVQGNFRAPRLK